MSAAPSVQQILKRLRALRRRIRALWALSGGARILIALSAVVVGFFLADWLLDLPLGVRRFLRLGLLDRPESMAVLLWLPALAVSGFLAWALTRSRRPGAAVCAFLFAGLPGLVAQVAIRALAPLRQRLSDDALASAVESRFTHLEDRLASALDFEGELRRHASGTAGRGESPAMMTQVVHDAVSEVDALRVTSAASPTRALRWAALAGGAVCLVILGASLLPDKVGLWYERSILLEDTPWPKQTIMVAVDLAEDGTATPHDPTVPIEVSLGRPVTIYAMAQGEIPDEVHLVDVVEGQEPLPRRMFALTEQPGLFGFEFRDVRRPFAFHIRGGDDDDSEPLYRVAITIPPRIQRIETEVTPPAYLGGQVEIHPGGNVAVAAGSKITVRFETDVPVAEAQALVRESRVAARKIEDLPSGGGLFALDLEPEKSLRYQLLLRTPEGRTNEGAVETHEIRVRRDRAPRVDWIHPRAGVQATPEGRIPLLLRAVDDHAVASLTLEVKWHDQPLRSIALQPHETRPAGAGADANLIHVLDGPLDRTQVLGYIPLDLPAWKTPEGEPLAPGQLLGMRVVATDSLGQVHEGEWIRADLFNKLERERGIVQRRPAIRRALTLLRGDQIPRMKDLQGVLADLSDPGAKDVLRTARFAQGRIAQDAHQMARQLFDLFNGYVLDRLGASNPTRKILGLMDRHHRTSYGLPPTGPEPGSPTGEVRTSLHGDPVWPYPLYARIVKGWQDKEIFDQGLLDRMCAVLEEAVHLASSAAPEAQAATVRALSGERADVEAAVAAQAEVLASLDRLLERIRSWQSLSDVTWQVRRLIEQQRTLQTNLEGPSGDAPQDPNDD